MVLFIQQNNLFKAREEKYQSRVKVLEALASGTSEESQVRNIIGINRPGADSFLYKCFDAVPMPYFLSENFLLQLVMNHHLQQIKVYFRDNKFIFFPLCYAIHFTDWQHQNFFSHAFTFLPNSPQSFFHYGCKEITLHLIIYLFKQ